MNDSRLIARVMLEQDETSLWELWVRYRTNCGDTDLFEFEAYLYGAHELPPVDLVVLSCAIKEVKAPMGGQRARQMTAARMSAEEVGSWGW